MKGKGKGEGRMGREKNKGRTLGPLLKHRLLGIVQPHPRLVDSLQDVVELLLGNGKDRRVSFGHEPLDVDPDEPPESDECVPHEGDAPSFKPRITPRQPSLFSPRTTEKTERKEREGAREGEEREAEEGGTDLEE